MEENTTKPAPQFLDEVLGEKALNWVRNQNSDALKKLQNDHFEQLRGQILQILEDDRRLVRVSSRGGHLYNFRTTAANPRGLWRRTTWETYPKDPKWEVLLDIDRLSKDEGESWVFEGASLLPESFDRALVRLSPGGSDACVIREFDLNTKEFVAGGFATELGKGELSWVDKNTVLVSPAGENDPLTPSGYPASTRLWKRGQSYQQAQVIYQTDQPITFVDSFCENSTNNIFVLVAEDFFNFKVYWWKDEELVALHLPERFELGERGNAIAVQPLQDWEWEGQVIPAGAIAVTDLATLASGSGPVKTVFTPSPKMSAESFAWTRHHLVITVTQDVVGKVLIASAPWLKDTRAESDSMAAGGKGSAGSESAQPGNFDWQVRQLQVPAGPFDMVGAYPVRWQEGDDIWVEVTGFLQPPSLLKVQLDENGNALDKLTCSAEPSHFDATGLKVQQFFATSQDGTQIPYFVVGPENQQQPAPCLLNGYGGFQVSRTPSYLAAAGKVWLEGGNVWALANIRGGGEYGPAWHQSALQENRHRAYEDYAAVASDLVKRGFTTPEQLACQGGSNGGLLVGNMLVQYPQLFGAIVCQVPLLDMRRYHTLLAGNSWMAEYGNPDIPEEWRYLRTFSPFHLYQDLPKDQVLPPVLFTTSTKDDRVHPAHARTMAWQMEEDGRDVTYYENTEGGHGGAADAPQRAFMQALAWEFLYQKLTAH